MLIFFIHIYEDYMFGFWSATDDNFCEDAGVRSIMLYISKPTGIFFKHRKCYLIIMDDIYNGVFDINYNAMIPFTTYKINSTNNNNIWPKSLSMEIDIRKGTLYIYKDSQLFAKLYKQHDSTELCK